MKHQYAILSVFSFCIVLLAACGGGDSTPPDEGDLAAPSVSSTSPADGSVRVPTNSIVTATFNEAMDENSINISSFTLAEAINLTGSVSYHAGNQTATFIPTTHLGLGTLHSATLATTITDAAGNALEAVKTWSFTTEDFIYRVSVHSNGTEALGDSNGVTISPDGRYVAFYSTADNLVSNDTNSFDDTFIHDTQTGITTLVSVASDGSQANEHSDEISAVSANGRYVAFYSTASNLIPVDVNDRPDIFLRDTVARTTTLISQSSSGVQGDDTSAEVAISPDGRYVAFTSYATTLVANDSNAVSDIFVRDTQNNTTTRVSLPNLADQGSLGTEGDGHSWGLSISADGRYVAFGSYASNLVLGDTNNSPDVFVHDRQTGATVRVNVPNLADQGTLGTQANISSSRGAAISANGQYVAFTSTATNLVIGDSNGMPDVFIHHLQTGETVRVSVPNLADQGTLGQEGDRSSASQMLSISADGRYVAFDSDATNLVSGDNNGLTDIFVHDRQSGTTIRVNLDKAGTQCQNSDSHSAYLSADGRYVAFISNDAGLVANDTNALGDIFRVLNTTP